MSECNKGIVADVVKVGILGVFLWDAFREVSFPSGLLKPTTTLITGGILAAAYFVGAKSAEHYKGTRQSYLTVLYIAGILAILAWATLGTHSENSDPLFG